MLLYELSSINFIQTDVYKDNDLFLIQYSNGDGGHFYRAADLGQSCNTVCESKGGWNSDSYGGSNIDALHQNFTPFDYRLMLV